MTIWDNFWENLDESFTPDIIEDIMTAFNIITLISSIICVYTLWNGFKNMKFPRNIMDDRRRIRRFFYEIVIVPCIIGFVGHYGARFPDQSVWIFPILFVALSLNVLWFINMMYVSCGGHKIVKLNLLKQKDRCGFIRMERRKCCYGKCCFLKRNAYIGLKSRMIWIYLIFVKPLFSFYIAYLISSGKEDRNTFGYLLKFTVFFCTFVPINGLKCFEYNIKSLSRMRRTTRKVNLIRFMVPLTQIQEFIINFLVNEDVIGDLNHINKKYRGARIEGMLLCVEMFICSVLSGFVYKASDLAYWDTYQQWKWDTIPNDNGMNIRKMSSDHYSEMSDLSDISGYSKNIINHKNKNKNNSSKLMNLPENNTISIALKQTNQQNYKTVKV